MDYWVRDKFPLPNFQNRWIKFPSIGNSKKFAQNLDTDIAAMVFWNTRKGIGRLKIKYHIDGRMECQPMDKADRRRKYAAFSVGVWQQGFESQSRYIALRIRAGEITPAIRDVV